MTLNLQAEQRLVVIVCPRRTARESSPSADQHGGYGQDDGFPLIYEAGKFAALASLNIDCAMFKVEPPAEYRLLGASLTEGRRTTAEDGSTHIVARRLGALFESILPEVPNLISAYGTRASDISQSPSFKVTNSAGPFAAFFGVDGTSIWAAASSGSAAIAVHLLACMLARVRSAAEAVSIWEELVAERKKKITDTTIQGNTSFANQMASKLSITRDQLSEWDASARAWRLSADAVDFVKPKQQAILDIIGDVRYPVGTTTDLYDSVIRTWTTALDTIDKLVSGVPHSVTDGAVLVALSSWHLFPDVVVIAKNKH
ncbi:MAG: hypothetical protein ACRYGG_02060 [Janthinobacterium lividum]